MINNRETLAVVAVGAGGGLSLKREFRKIRPLFFLLPLSALSHLHIHIFIYISLYIYNISLCLVCHTLNGTSDRRDPPTAGDLGRGKGWDAGDGCEKKETPVSEIQR